MPENASSRIRRILLGFVGMGTLYAALRVRARPARTHPFLSNDGPLVIAHRGGRGLWPPNTLYAFERAIALGADVLEMDIHSSADGALVVRHDPTVDATTDGRGPIRNYTLAKLKSLDAGYRWTADGGGSYPYRGLGITIPTLDEVLEAFPDMRLNIDIKPQDPAVVEPFCRLLREYNRLEQVIVGSFHDDQLRRFRSLCPEVATAAGLAETRWFFLLNSLFLGRVYRARAEAFQIPEYAGGLHLVTRRFVRGAHARNVQVHVWTVNETAEMQRLLDWGVDGLITDYPDRLLALLGRQPGGKSQ
ncbi:MAG: glycerophosphodiester phosphodiesterase [Anaerolineales bacterium]|nr:glycerophosphodiester phosphodiesterase [Anaerolineales bacterium]